MLSLLNGLTLGFGAAIPLGPINILIMSNALNSYKNAVSIGFGAMSADIIYLLLTLSGALHFANNPKVLKVISIFGVLFLIYIAWQIFKSRDNKIIKDKSESNNNILKNYFKGLSLTLLNPYTIGFWLSVSATITTKNLNPLFTLCGVVIAIIIWITLMPLFIYKSKHLISKEISKYLSITSSLVMVYFAAMLLYALTK